MWTTSTVHVLYKRDFKYTTLCYFLQRVGIHCKRDPMSKFWLKFYLHQRFIKCKEYLIITKALDLKPISLSYPRQETLNVQLAYNLKKIVHFCSTVNLQTHAVDVCRCRSKTTNGAIPRVVVGAVWCIVVHQKQK